MPSTSNSHLSSLNTHWHNHSMSSISAVSEAATFYSSLQTMEMASFSITPSHPQPASKSSDPTNTNMNTNERKSTSMSRQDSGYADTSLITPSRRTSTSSTRPSQCKRRTTASSRTSRRSSRDISRHHSHGHNHHHPPSLSSRHSLSYPYQNPHSQYYHFPALTITRDASPSPSPPPTAPPATVHYWTSDSTRRLEYAAIDAASKGVRGFLVKLVPDCILPVGARRTKFYNGPGGRRADNEDSDGESVRRYRLVLPKEEVGGVEGCEKRKSEERSKRPGILRRWSIGFGRRG